MKELELRFILMSSKLLGSGLGFVQGGSDEWHSKIVTSHS